MEITSLGRHPIVSGPSKYDYLASHCHRLSPILKVKFTIKPTGKLYEEDIDNVRIMASWQMGSEEVFNQEGHEWGFFGVTPRSTGQFVVGCYSTKNRCGWLKFVGREVVQAIYAIFNQTKMSD
ncbi:MAG: hypothetical protein AAB450_01660 [Patescibacteria group bacterium]